MNNIIDICNANIQSLCDGKIDAIKAELMLNFDICLTETNLPHARVTDFDQQSFLYKVISVLLYYKRTENYIQSIVPNKQTPFNESIMFSWLFGYFYHN